MNNKYILEIFPCQTGKQVIVRGSSDLVDACRSGLRSFSRRLRFGEMGGKEFIKVPCIDDETPDQLCKNIVRGLCNVIELRGKDYCNGGNI